MSKIYLKCEKLKQWKEIFPCEEHVVINMICTDESVCEEDFSDVE